MRFPHRCNKCKGRFTLKRKKLEYEIPRKCPQCGSESFYFDTYEYKRRLNAKPCNCDGRHFPHRKGSRYCVHNKNAAMDDLERRRYGY